MKLLRRAAADSLGGTDAEALIEEARRRQRRRWWTIGSLVLVVAVPRDSGCLERRIGDQAAIIDKAQPSQDPGEHARFGQEGHVRLDRL